MNSFLDDRKAIDRLKFEYTKYNNFVIGFDFDCTVYDYHHEGLNVRDVVELLRRCKKLGFTMCLYSNCTKEEDVNWKLNYCEVMLDIKPDFFNESPLIPISFPVDKRKPFFSILLDDRAGLSAAYNILLTTLDELNL